MKTAALTLALALLCIWMPHRLVADKGPSTVIDWSSYSEAVNQDKGNRKFFLYFYTDQCPACVMLKKDTFADAAVIDYLNTNYTPIKINAAKEPKLASRFRIQGVPDMRFLTPEGKDIARWLGYIESKRFYTLLQYIDTDSYKKVSYKEFMKQQQDR